MNRTILITAAVLGILSIVLGAFAAHGLEKLVSEEAINSFETGVRFQMYHAIVLLFIGTTDIIGKNAKRVIFYLMLVGLILFSGSIYGLATNALTGFDFKTFAFVTPIGGFMLIISWVVLLINFIKIGRD